MFFLDEILEDEEIKETLLNEKELMAEGKETNDVRTDLELLIVKHTLIAAKQAQNNCDTIQF